MAQINCNVYVFFISFDGILSPQTLNIGKSQCCLGQPTVYKLHELTEPACKSAYLPTPQNIIGPTFKQDVGGI